MSMPHLGHFLASMAIFMPHLGQIFFVTGLAGDFLATQLPRFRTSFRQCTAIIRHVEIVLNARYNHDSDFTRRCQ